MYNYYNDQNRSDNEYHYSYRSDASGFQPQQTPVPLTPKKKNRAGKAVALVLCGALLVGGGFGAGWYLNSRDGRGETQMMVSERPLAKVETVSVTGSNALTFSQIYDANVDSCVSINTSGTASMGYNIFGQPVQREFASAGSGFILTKDGYIATNYHVIEGASMVKVTLDDGTTYEAKIIGGDADYDIAILKVDPGENELKPVTVGTSSSLKVGENVSTIGNPLGQLTFSLTHGIISCLDREINLNGTPFNMIQVDTSINPGNSGGPLFNQYGEVVGIVSAKYSQSSNGTTVEGLGFAIPMNDVFSMVKDIMANGYVSNRAYLGITPQTMTESWAAQFHYDVTSGVFINYVEPDSAADKAGLKMGDVITKVDGTDIKSVEDLNLAKKKYSAGDSATLEVYRPDGTVTVEITWGAAPKEDQAAQQQETQQYPGNRNDNSGNGGSYGSPFEDLFRYFYG